MPKVISEKVGQTCRFAATLGRAPPTFSEMTFGSRYSPGRKIPHLYACCPVWTRHILISIMNPKRLILAVVVVFVGLWLTSFLIHGVWLNSIYKETMSLWRSEAEMTSHMVWMLLGQLLWSLAFVLIWSKGFPAVASLGRSCLYGLTMGMFSEANSLIMYTVEPLPGHLVAKWVVAGLAQGALLGILVYHVGKPKGAA
jgi:hypothetical protein